MTLVNSSLVGQKIQEFYYGVSGVPERYTEVHKVFLISPVDFYYVINKLIVLVSKPH
jgi:hypothetical protein